MAANYKIKVEIDDAQANRQVAALNRQIAAIGTASGSTGVSALNNQLQQLVAQNPALGNVVRSLGGTSAVANQAAGNLNRMAAAANNNSTAVGTLQQTVGAATSRLGALNGTLGSLALAGATTGVLGLAGAFAYATNAARGYLDKMAEISTLVNTATFSMDGLSQGLKDQAVLYGQSPIAQAGAAYDIISSGATSAKDAILTLNSANLLAAVGATTVGVAADGVTSALNAYRSSNLTAKDAADSMFLTVRDGKITMEELSGSIGNVVPMAATLGVSLDEVGASIAALTLSGVKGAEAVTNIRGALTAIIKPSAEASKLAQKLGIDFSSSALKAKGWPKFLEEVKSKTGGSTDALAVLFGGVEGLSAALALTGTANKAFNDTLDHMATKSGVAAEALKKIQDASPSFQMGRVMAAINVEAINLGTTIANALTPALKFVADNFHNAAVGAAALGSAFVVFKGLTIASSIIQSATALGTLAQAAGALNTVIRIATGAQALFNAVVLMNPFIAAAAALVGIGVLLYEFRDAINIGGGSVASLGDLFSATWEVMTESIGPVISAITTGFNTAYNAVSGFVSSAIEIGKSFGSPFFVAIDAISSLFESAFGDLTFSISGILVGAARTVDGLIGLFRGGWLAIVALWNGLPAAIGPNFQAFLAGAKSVVSAIGSGIAYAYNSVVSFGASCVASVSSAFNSVGSFIEKWVNKAISGINSVIGSANKLGAGLAPLTNVTIGKIAAPTAKPTGFAKLGQDMGAAFRSGFSNEAEAGMKSFLGRADAIGRKRLGGGSPAAGNDNDNGGGGGGKGAPVGATGGSGGARSPAAGGDSEAKKIADRIKKENEYFQALEQTATVAAMLPLAAEQYNKELELRKIRGDGELKDNIVLAAGDVTRIQNAIKLREQNELTRNIKAATGAADIEAVRIADQMAASAGVSAAKAAENLAIEEKLWPFKKANLELQKIGLGLSDQELQKQLALLDVAERRNFAAQKANAAASSGADYANGSIAQFGTRKDKEKLAKDDQALRVAQLQAALDQGKISGEAFRSGVRKSTDEFETAMANVSGSFANDLSGFLGKLGGMIGGKAGEVLNAGSGVASAIGGFADTKKDITGSFEKLFGDSKSGLVKGIGSAVGGAMAGLKIGEAIGGLGKALGLKHFETGAKIGGAIGGLTGNPLIAAAASVIGGLIESIIYKAPSATATITGAEPVKVTGNKAAARDAVSLTATSIQKGLQSIASQLGGTVGSFAVSIGKREDYYRVIAEGGKNAGAKHPAGEGTLLYNGTDEAQAIAIAIQNAIEDGGITGITGTLQRALTVLGTESAVAFAQSWSAAMDDYDAMLNPVAAAIKAVNAPIDSLKATLVAIGDTAADQMRLEQYRAAKIAEVMKQQTKTFTDLLSTLNGEGVGITALTRLNSDLDKFKSFQTDIAAGKQVNQEDFSSLVNKILGESKDVYGTATAPAEAMRQMLIDATTAAQKIVTDQFIPFDPSKNIGAANDNTPTAGDNMVATRIDTTNQQMAINNAYQSQILEAIQNLNSVGGAGARYQLNERLAQV